jgi:hypothetical protein
MFYYTLIVHSALSRVYGTAKESNSTQNKPRTEDGTCVVVISKQQELGALRLLIVSCRCFSLTDKLRKK